MSALKRRTATVLLLVIFVIFVAGYLFLSGRTFYATLVADKVGEAFQTMGGYDLEIHNLRGNPLTGVDGSSVRVVHGEVTLASADQIEIRLDLTSVLSSPKLSRLSLSGLTADLDTVLNHLPQKKQKSSGPPALEQLTLHDSKISTPYGDVDVKDMSMMLSEEGYRIDLHGAYRAEPFSLQADLRTAAGELSLRQVALEWRGVKLKAEGALSPSLDLSCVVSELDVNVFSDLLPQLKSADVQGVYSAEVRLRRDEVFSATGSVRSETGQIARVPFDDLRANIRYADGGVEIEDLSVRLWDGTLSGDARIALTPKSPPVVSLDLTARDVNVSGMRTLFPQLRPIAGRFNAFCKVSGGMDDLDGRIFLNAERVNAYEVEVTGASAEIRLTDSASLALVFDGKALGAEVGGAGNVGLKPAIQLELEADVAELALEALANRFPQIAEAGIRGVGTARVKIHGPRDGLVVDGDLSFPTLTVLREHDLKEVSADFSYDKNVLSLTQAKAVFNEAIVTAEGAYARNASGGEGDLGFTGSFSNLQLENFYDLAPAIRNNDFKGTVSGKWSLNGTTGAPRVNLALTAPAVSFLKRFALSNVAAEVNYDDGAIEVVDTSVRMGSASASAAGSILLPPENQPVSYNIKGSFRDLHPEDLVKMGLVSADLSGDLAGDFRVWSKDGKVPSARVFFKNARIVYSNLFDISGLGGAVTLDDGNLRLDRLRTMINEGYASVTGTVGNIAGKSFAPENIPLDLNVSISSADIGRISRFFMPNSKGYQGIVTASADIGGNVAAPRFRGGASLSGVRAFGLFLPVVRIHDVSGNLNEIRFPNVRAIVGRGVIDGHGSIQKTPEDWRAKVEATGRSVDIRSLTFSLEREMRREIGGTLDFDFQGDGGLDSFEGSGELRVPSFSAMGIKITDFRAPFWVNDGFVLIEDSTAKGYGGEIRAQVAKDLTLSNWGGRVEVLSVDFAMLLKDLMPALTGSITGSADLSLRLQGDSARTSMQDGNGNFVIRNGEIIGFPGTEAISRATRGKPLRFSSAVFPFSIDGKTLYFLPGTRISAPTNDPVFNYVMADGSIVLEEKEIALSCIGNVNVRALNSFMGGLQGLLSAAMSDASGTDALLENFLGGALSGFSRNEFRDVSLIVNGVPGNLHFSNIEVAQPMTYDARPEVLNQVVDERQIEEERFQLKVEFPVGPGGGRASNLGGQVGGQVFEQAIKSLFSF